MEIRIRRAAFSDLPAVKEMYAALVARMDREGWSVWDETYPRDFVGKDIEQGQLYLLLEGDRLAGAFALPAGCALPQGKGERPLKPLVSQLWPQFNADEAFARCFAGVLVEQVELLRISRKLKISLRSAAPLPIELCGRLCASLAPQCEGLELMVCNYFPFETITEESLRAMIDELRGEGLPVNGFLDHAAFALQGTQLVITVPVGKNILEGIGFGDTLAKLVEQRTGVLPTVTLEQNSSVSADSKCSSDVTPGIASNVCPVK